MLKSTKTTPVVKVDAELARKVACLVDFGLVGGKVGDPIPGRMCVEAAVAFACGDDHNDKPLCVHPTLGGIKIELNDIDGPAQWSSDEARAKGMRRIAVAQLGSRKTFNPNKFWAHVNRMIGERYRADVLKAVSKLKGTLLSAGTVRAALNAPEHLREYNHGYVDSSDSAARAVKYLFFPETFKPHTTKARLELDDKILSYTAELFVQALIKMKIKGTKYLKLTEGKMNRKAIMAKLYRDRAKKGKVDYDEKGNLIVKVMPPINKAKKAKKRSR